MNDYDVIKDYLMKSGVSEEDAHAAAARFVHDRQTVQPGFRYGGGHDETVSHIWKQARRTGARRLVLEIEVESDDYHVQITVKERDGITVRQVQGN